MVSIRVADVRDAAVLADLGRRTCHETFAAHNTPEDMAAYTAEAFTVWDPRATDLSDLWPGPLTLVLPRRGVPDVVTGGHPTVAVRVPDCWRTRIAGASTPASTTNARLARKGSCAA